LLGVAPTGALAEEPAGLSITPTALLQVWAVAWDQDQDPQADPAGYGDPEDDPGFKIRRARIGAEGELGEGVFFDVEFGASSPYDAWTEADSDIRLVDGSLGWRHAAFELVVGQQKVPYSREQLISSGELVYTERAVTTHHLAPGRETGLVAAYGWKGLHLRAGVFNGSGSFLGDDNAGVLGAGRLSYSTGEAGEDMQTWGQVDHLVLSAAANGYYNADLSTSTLGLGGDLLLRVSGLALLLEGHSVDIQPTATDVAPSDVMDGTPRVGLTGQVGYSLGAFENAVRVAWFDDDTGAADNGDIWELYGGTTAHLLEDQLRLGLGYVHRHELAGQTLPNDTIRLWAQARY